MKGTEFEQVALVAQYEKIVEVLKQNNYSKTNTAKALGIDRKTLYSRLNNPPIPLYKTPLPEQMAKQKLEHLLQQIEKGTNSQVEIDNPDYFIEVYAMGVFDERERFKNTNHV